MLYLLFKLGSDRYALDASAVREVLPVVNWKEIPQSSAGVLGVFNYHGEVVPLLDLSQYIAGSAARLQMSTRIILVNYKDAGGSFERLLGLLAEGATFTFRATPEQFAASGVEVEGAPYLGPVITDAGGIIQLVDVQQLLPHEVKQQLFLRAVEKEAG